RLPSAGKRPPRDTAPPEVPTAPLSSRVLASRPPVTPFEPGPAAPRAARPRDAAAPRPAATPFDTGFGPVDVTPAASVDETLAPSGAAPARIGQEVRSWLEAQRQPVGDEATVALDETAMASLGGAALGGAAPGATPLAGAALGGAALGGAALGGA